MSRTPPLGGGRAFLRSASPTRVAARRRDRRCVTKFVIVATWSDRRCWVIEQGSCRQYPAAIDVQISNSILDATLVSLVCDRERSGIGTDRRCWLSVSSSAVEGRPAVLSLTAPSFDPNQTSASRHPRPRWSWAARKSRRRAARAPLRAHWQSPICGAISRTATRNQACGCECDETSAQRLAEIRD
jgi:hypothetical protein